LRDGGGEGEGALVRGEVRGSTTIEAPGSTIEAPASPLGAPVREEVRGEPGSTIEAPESTVETPTSGSFLPDGELGREEERLFEFVGKSRPNLRFSSAIPCL
jgi:hypothetical protein